MSFYCPETIMFLVSRHNYLLVEDFYKLNSGLARIPPVATCNRKYSFLIMGIPEPLM